MEQLDVFLSNLPAWSLAVMSTSLGWIIGSLILYVWIELKGGF